MGALAGAVVGVDALVGPDAVLVDELQRNMEEGDGAPGGFVREEPFSTPAAASATGCWNSLMSRTTPARLKALSLALLCGLMRWRWLDRC